MAKILVVDDSTFQRSILRKFLEENGHEAILAENGVKALERLADNPDAILCDLVMPELDGFGFLEKLLELKVTVPTTVISADIQTSAHERCKALGAFGFLNKPVDETTVIEQVASMLTERND
jgi:two-component system chemotaxis response regulator CheY